MPATVRDSRATMRARARDPGSTTQADVQSPGPMSSSRAARTARRSASVSIMDAGILPYAPEPVNTAPGAAFSPQDLGNTRWRRCSRQGIKVRHKTSPLAPAVPSTGGTDRAHPKVARCSGFSSGEHREAAEAPPFRGSDPEPPVPEANRWLTSVRIFLEGTPRVRSSAPSWSEDATPQPGGPTMWNRRILLASLSAIVLFGTPAFAQETTTGTITGNVTDPTGRGIPGAVVIATSGTGTQVAESDAKGHYVLPFLRPGTYTLRVEAPGGFNTVVKSDVTVGLNVRVQMDFTLEPGKTETVTVTGETPLVDPKSTASSTNLKYEDFANSVPLGRSFTDTYAVAPGVVSGLGTGQGNYAISGASGLENSYLIDGVNVTNTGYGGIGAYNIVYGSLGTGVTSEFLDEVQIKTGGFEAEYGQALGGIINTIVKSGTNDFKGSVSWFSTPGGARSNYSLVNLDTGTTNQVYEDVQDYAFSLGGPIKKDKLFYFVAFNPVVTTQRNQANSIENPGFAAAQAGNPRFTDASTGFNVTDAQAFPSAGGELERKRTADNYALKLSWRASEKQQLELTFFGDPAVGAQGFQRDIAPLYTDFASGGGQSRIEYGSNNGTLKWNGVFTPTFFAEGQISRHVGKFREDPTVDETRYRDLRNNLEFRRGATDYSLDGTAASTAPFRTPVTPVVDYRGGVGFISNQDDKSTPYLLKLTNLAGKHEIKWGLEYDDISYLDTATYTGSSFNVQLPVSNDAGDPVDAEDCTSVPGTCSPGSDGIQDVLLIPTRGGAQVDVRNGNGDPTVAYDSANRFRVTRARMGPALPPTSATESNAFVQDTWSIAPRVTLKLGVRATKEAIAGAGR